MHVLREAVEAVRGESLKFEKDLMRSTTEMGRMVEIEDIRELKRALSAEVQTIRAAVAERQKNEAKHYDTLTSRVQSLEQSLVKARAEAATDALTQLPNRGAFDVAVREWVERARHNGQVFTVAMVDLDDFKRINDTYGHPVGDRVITTMGQLLRGVVGEDEFVARFGGEEFALLLTSRTAGKAKDRLSGLLDRLPPSFEYEQDGVKRFVSFSFSAGVTAWVGGDTTDSIVKRADEALYDAKRRGKRRVETRPRSMLRGLIG
ncbi:MAG: GGDEF domain-containing protein [Vicinamibacterales bacterium]